MIVDKTMMLKHLGVEHDYRNQRSTARPSKQFTEDDGQSTVLSNFNLIAGGESRVDALDALLSLSQSGLSRHLAHLPRDGLVFNNRQTQTIYN